MVLMNTIQVTNIVKERVNLLRKQFHYHHQEPIHSLYFYQLFLCVLFARSIRQDKHLQRMHDCTVIVICITALLQRAACDYHGDKNHHRLVRNSCFVEQESLRLAFGVQQTRVEIEADRVLEKWRSTGCASGKDFTLEISYWPNTSKIVYCKLKVLTWHRPVFIVWVFGFKMFLEFWWFNALGWR